MPAKHSLCPIRIRVAASLLSLAATSSAIPLQNPNFDHPLVPPDKDYIHFDSGFNQPPSDFGWTLVSGTVELVNGHYWFGPNGSGDQSLDLNGNDSGHISQDVFLSPGRYLVSFALSGNPDGGDEKLLQVSLGTLSSNFAFDSSGHTHTAMGWEVEKALFGISSAGVYSLSFESLTRGPYGVAIDSVTVTQVPEAMGLTGTMWLGAFALVTGFFARRK